MNKATEAADLLLSELKKAKKMPVGTVSHGRKKVAEGKWVPVGDDKKTQNNVKKTIIERKDFEKIMEGEGIDTTRIPKDVSISNLSVTENPKAPGFYHTKFDIKKDGKIKSYKHVSSTIENIGKLKKFIIMQLAYKNYQ